MKKTKERNETTETRNEAAQTKNAKSAETTETKRAESGGFPGAPAFDCEAEGYDEEEDDFESEAEKPAEPKEEDFHGRFCVLSSRMIGKRKTTREDYYDDFETMTDVAAELERLSESNLIPDDPKGCAQMLRHLLHDAGITYSRFGYMVKKNEHHVRDKCNGYAKVNPIDIAEASVAAKRVTELFQGSAEHFLSWPLAPSRWLIPGKFQLKKNGVFACMELLNAGAPNEKKRELLACLLARTRMSIYAFSFLARTNRQSLERFLTGCRNIPIERLLQFAKLSDRAERLLRPFRSKTYLESRLEFYESLRNGEFDVE